MGTGGQEKGKKAGRKEGKKEGGKKEKEKGKDRLIAGRRGARTKPSGDETHLFLTRDRFRFLKIPVLCD